jgi:energy-coupling factor transporter ATP-binding protein EcfA2
MASTTNSKKEIIDFLWEWADPKGEWARLLVDNVVKTEAALSSVDRQLVFDYFIDSLRTTKQMPALNLVKPKFNSVSKDIKLKSLSKITGVNKLAKNQTMSFSDNMTIIYGENGTGKTGYGRILKSLGFSYDPHNVIHNDIFGVPEAKSAVIDFTSNGILNNFIWDGNNENEDLSNISVFNNNCVQLSLSDRKLIVSPIGFHLFNIITNELGELVTLLNNKKNKYPESISFITSLHEGTPQLNFINALSSKTTDLELQKVTDFPTDIDLAIGEKKKNLLGLNEQLITNEISSFSLQIKELKTLLSTISKERLNETHVNEFITLTKSITDLQSKSKLGLKDIAEVIGIQFYDSEEFKTFLESAEKYIKLLEQPYPKEEDLCIYCNQPLDESAQKLLHSYKTLLQDSTESDLKQLEQTKDLELERIKELTATYSFTLPCFGSDENGNPVIPKEIINLNSEVSLLKKAFINNTVISNSTTKVSYDIAMKKLEGQILALQKQLDEKNATLLTISARSLILENEIAELSDRKVLLTNLQEIKDVIKNKKSLALLNSKSSEFSSNTISRKTTEAREELISQNFNDIFQKELKALRKSHIKIDLNFGTDRGNSKISHRINQFALGDILSEGEQKAIALAEFLTELQLDKTQAPIIFDDPVNSLDHTILDEVAKRLIELSKSRQVVIFTHSILLLNSLLQQRDLDTTKQAGIGFTFYSVKNNFGETGFLGDVEEINSFSDYHTKLKAVINCTDRSLDEATLAAEGYGHLRSMIEVCVEKEVLKETVKRYRKGVAFPSLLRIKGDKIDGHKGRLNDIYEKCCTSIAGHSSPSEIHTAPTIVVLKADYEDFIAIRNHFI